MHTTRKSRRALSRIHQAIQAGFAYGLNDGGAGGGGATPPTPPAAPPTAPKPNDPPAPKKIELTEDELQSRITAALEKDRQAAQAKADMEKAEREEEEAKKRGEFEKLANSEKAKREAAEATIAELKRTNALRDYIAEHKAEFSKAAPLIGKLIDPNEADTDKAIKAAVAEYEKSLPEKPKGSAGVPERGRVIPTSKQNGHHQPLRPVSVASSRF